MSDEHSPSEQPSGFPHRREASSTYCRGASGPGQAVFGLGLIGALVYYWQEAHSFWQYVLAVLKSMVWPALLVYDALRSLHS